MSATFDGFCQGPKLFVSVGLIYKNFFSHKIYLVDITSKFVAK